MPLSNKFSLSLSLPLNLSEILLLLFVLTLYPKQSLEDIYIALLYVCIYRYSNLMVKSFPRKRISIELLTICSRQSESRAYREIRLSGHVYLVISFLVAHFYTLVIYSLYFFLNILVKCVRLLRTSNMQS